MSAPSSASLLTLFRLSSTHRCCLTWGFGFHLSLSTGSVCQMQRCTLRLSVLWRKSYRFLVSLHIHDTTYSFRISPCPLCSLLWISGLWHSAEIDSLSVVDFFRRLLRPLIINRPDTTIFLTGEQLSCFSGPFVPCLFVGISWHLDSAPSTLLSGATSSAMIPTGQAEKSLRRRESPISYD